MTGAARPSAPKPASADGPSVLLLALSLRFGGADVRVRQMARALHAAGRRYAVAVIDGSDLHRALAAEGLRTAPLAHARSDPRLALALRSLMVSQGYDVIDAHNPQSQYWGSVAAWAAGGRGCVSTVHSIYRKAHGALPRALLHEGALRLNLWAGARFIAISGSIHEYLRGLGVPDDRILLSRNGIAPAPATPEPAGLRTALGWDRDSFVVAAIGRLEPVKAHDVLLRAVALLRERHPALRCVIVGDGREDARLRECAAQLELGGIVHFTGFRSDVANILADADAFCLPSLMEGIPYAALEAAQSELPLILSGIGGLTELFTHRRDAWLVKPGCVDDLAAGLDWVMNHRTAATSMAAEARRMVAARFDTGRMVAETLALYDEVALRVRQHGPPGRPEAMAGPRPGSSTS
ncbi:glycosyltransferase family 4 protein [Azospirillum sp. TSO35-2]|uniref:glycosyltransferase family 4 protein n=1 Tax=Azospirillum sp. TSO35-2 TaxID=716796 RepID=UPI000D6101B0|nr:glycosyltransferase family 4 protein [Azospirillum sp. TSO35-2]PWC35991.1 hypothetical protein TSO352_12455 [Azospirillum sp. TSO35-2]